MSAAATVASVLGALTVAACLGFILGIWLPVMAACALTPALAFDEALRGWKRWRATCKWAARLSA